MIIETLQNLGIPIYSIPELSMVFIWNESNFLFLYTEYNGELEQVDVKVIKPFYHNFADRFETAYDIAHIWADQIRSEEKQ